MKLKIQYKHLVGNPWNNETLCGLDRTPPPIGTIVIKIMTCPVCRKKDYLKQLLRYEAVAKEIWPVKQPPFKYKKKRRHHD